MTFATFFFKLQYVLKPPRTILGAFAWHQDSENLPPDQQSYLSAWVALEDMTVDNGCLWVLPGSHRAGACPPPGPGATEPPTQSLELRAGAAQKAAPLPAAMPLPVSRGTVILLHDRIWHCSFPNASSATRRAWMPQYKKMGPKGGSAACGRRGGSTCRCLHHAVPVSMHAGASSDG